MMKWIKNIFIILLCLLVIYTLISIINSENPSYLVNGISKLIGNFHFVLLFLALFTIAFLFRAVRWNILLLENFSSKLYFFKLIFIAWFLNAVTPARLGDISCVYYPKKDKKATAGKSLLALFIVRLMDISFLLILLMFWTLFGFSITDNKYQIWVIFVVLSLLIMFLLFMVLSIFYPQIFIKILSYIPNEKLKVNGVKIMQNFREGIKSLSKSPEILINSIVFTLIIWILESTSVILISTALGFKLNLEICLMAATLGFIGAAIPLLPSGLGSYEAGIASVLYFLGNVNLQSAILIAFFDHIIRQLYVIIIGGILFLTRNTSISEIKEPNLLTNLN